MDIEILFWSNYQNKDDKKAPNYCSVPFWANYPFTRQFLALQDQLVKLAGLEIANMIGARLTVATAGSKLIIEQVCPSLATAGSRLLIG